MRDGRGDWEKRQTNRWRGKEGKSAVGLESCYSFCPDFFFFFLLKNIPQVQYLLWSTKLPNVLISTANAAGKQEDRV